MLITDGAAKRLSGVNLDGQNVTILKVGGDPKNLLKLSREELRPIRDKLLAPFGMKFDAPNKVALYLIGDNVAIVENFNDEPIEAALELPKSVTARKALVLPVDGDVELAADGRKVNLKKIAPRTLVAIEY